MNSLDHFQRCNYFNTMFLASLVVLLYSCNSDPAIKAQNPSESQDNTEVELTVQQFQSSDMQLGYMLSQPFHEKVKATGMIDVPPQYRAEVSSNFSGTVGHIKLIPGQYVDKGQLLFTIQNPDFVQVQQDYLEAQGQLDYLRSDYQRQKRLRKDNVVSEKVYLKAKSDYTVTQIRYESLAKKLSLMNINPRKLSTRNMITKIGVYAPISGYVTDVRLSEGAYLSPSVTAVSIINTFHLHAELDIFEKDIDKIKIGQELDFKTQSNRHAVYPATVHLINRTVDPEKRTISIHAHLKKESQRNNLDPGMYVEAQIYTSTSSKYALPKDAVVEADGLYYVLMLDKRTDKTYHFVRKEVKPGETYDDHIEILNFKTFDLNSKFLIKGAFNLIKD